MSLSDLIERVHDLPSLPLVANQINIETRSDKLTAKALAEIVSRDPSLAVKVLKLANSAYYGLVREVTTIDKAITLLGFNTIRTLALTLSVFDIFVKRKNLEVDMEGLWHHSLGCAAATKTVVGITNPLLKEEAFLCGLLHDIGIIAMLSAFPDKMAAAITMVKESHIPLAEAEEITFGFTHQEAGAFLTERWNFPEKYFTAIRLHHNPFVGKVDQESPDSLLIFAVYAGNQIAKVMSLGRSFDMKMTGIDPKTWPLLGMNTKMLTDVKGAVRQEYGSAMATWGLPA
ncbi:MAG: hypothetical protein A2521_05945 [Deltaproteobacteria bacterium RIFOXYD12_FULL_57_12]|nr:MAG: hypothetical protein A2521_05945 [Deltaproteobacteria bacterium RIFOXYD12_FULL_57_12]